MDTATRWQAFIREWTCAKITDAFSQGKPDSGLQSHGVSTVPWSSCRSHVEGLSRPFGREPHRRDHPHHRQVDPYLPFDYPCHYSAPANQWDALDDSFPAHGGPV